MKVLKTPQEMTTTSLQHIRQGKSIGFVPTMGAFHEGHISLVERSCGENDITVVSIFVNPLQFGPSEDLAHYPRDIDSDLKILSTLNVDVVFIPEASAIYPDTYHTYVTVEELTSHLCGAFRPDHFRGVATVVAKLFNIAKPRNAYFGQKDFQQALVIETMTKDLNMGIDVVVCPIVREADGLAMSSRNTYMSGSERRAAGIIFRALREIAEKLQKRTLPLRQSSSEFQRIFSTEPLVSEVQYASAFNPRTLEEIHDNGYSGRALLAVALKIGKTRLIDNMLVEI